MSDFVDHTCSNCGTDFQVHPSGRAAETGYCSPACHTAGEGL